MPAERLFKSSTSLSFPNHKKQTIISIIYLFLRIFFFFFHDWKIQHLCSGSACSPSWPLLEERGAGPLAPAPVQLFLLCFSEPWCVTCSVQLVCWMWIGKGFAPGICCCRGFGVLSGSTRKVFILQVQTSTADLPSDLPHPAPKFWGTGTSPLGKKKISILCSGII